MITASVTEKSSILKWRVFLGFGLISFHRQWREFRPRLESSGGNFLKPGQDIFNMSITAVRIIIGHFSVTVISGR